MAEAIATAYVKLIPTFEHGLGTAISKELGNADAKGAGKKAGKQFTSGVEGGMSGLKDAVSGKFSAATVAIGNLMSSAITSAVSSAASGIGSLMSTAFSGFADYQQLNSGMKLAFGDAFSYIEERSQRAFETVGLSQNDYLRQVNGFAVGLKTSMGGSEQAAAELADKIVSAEADIVAAMGISEEAAQNAFNGIMKGNYMMLDNLQIGIKPTKEGMQEVIDKVNEWNAAQGKASEYTIDNLADCEAALVDYVDMVGYAGYAQGEAFETVSGSVSMLKGAWTNLISSLGRKDADFGQLAEDLNMALAAVFANVVPMLGNIATNVVDKIPMVFSNLGGAIETTLLPQLQTAFSGVLDKLGIHFDDEKMTAALGGLSDMFDRLSKRMQEIADVAGPALSGFFSEMGPVVLDVVGAVLYFIDSIGALVQGIGELPGYFGAAFDAIGRCFDDVGTAAKNAFEGIVTFARDIPKRIVEFFVGLGGKIMEAIGNISLPIDLGGIDVSGIVPQFADGGFVDRPTLMVAGEAGHEMVLSKRGSMMSEFADALSTRMGASQSVTNIYIDGVQALPDTRIYEVAYELATTAYDQRRA